jgi:glycosyltransferase involved in cell wall biosynthesis
MEQQVRRSTLLAGAEVRVIANAFDTTVFAPQDRNVARTMLGLPQDKILILAGAVQLSDPRKGFSHFRAALRGLRGVLDANRVEIVVSGAGAGGDAEIEGFRANYLGFLSGDLALARGYAAADVFVLPSLEDNLPNSAIEAMAVGVPVVAYGVGGIPEIVDHEETGLLAELSQPNALGSALARMVLQSEFREYCGRQSRLKVLRTFDSTKIAEAHRALYREVVERL